MRLLEIWGLKAQADVAHHLLWMLSRRLSGCFWKAQADKSKDGLAVDNLSEHARPQSAEVKVTHIILSCLSLQVGVPALDEVQVLPWAKPGAHHNFG